MCLKPLELDPTDKTGGIDLVLDGPTDERLFDAALLLSANIVTLHTKCTFFRKSQGNVLAAPGAPLPSGPMDTDGNRNEENFMEYMWQVLDKLMVATNHDNLHTARKRKLNSVVSGGIGDDRSDLSCEDCLSIPSASSSSDHTAQEDIEKVYVRRMSGLQYAEVDGELVGYSYKAEAGRLVSTSRNKARVRRIGQEHADMSHGDCEPDSAPLRRSNHPCSLSSTIWMRTSAERMDTASCIICGPDDTPYSNGLFFFDIFFPDGYPTGPPSVKLQTTGNGTMRFNPNLYNCGKVCLSLLGTWSGSQGESWDEQSSTLLQVLVSIQSLILVPDPYFNEPGYERAMGTAEGDRVSAIYNENIMLGTIRHAMLDHLENTGPPEYSEVMRLHFAMKREIIRAQVRS